MKICSNCKVEKPYKDFSKDVSRKDGFCVHCTVCRTAITRKVYTNHNPTAGKRHPNTGTFNRAEYNRQYRKSDLARNAAYAAKRRATKLQATPKWFEKALVEELYQESERITDESGILHNVDHIVPLQNDRVCGLHCIANLQILTEEENGKKNNTFV